MTRKRDFLSLDDLTAPELGDLFARTAQLKRELKEGKPHATLAGKVLGMVFEKPSTRTRVSFEVGMFQLGGKALFLSARDLQLGRGEPISDSARVFSRYVDGLMVRTFAHDNVATMARHASIPVINGLSDALHPCQLLADMFTFQEHRGSLGGKRVAWIGDGNNMANTWIQAAALVGFHLVLACPVNYEPDPVILAAAREAITARHPMGQASVSVVRDPMLAAEGAHLVTTDTWTSMGQESEQQRRLRAFEGYTVNDAMMARAHGEALFMHCLPAHRGEEVTDAVMDGPRSVVWDEAENRLHVQKAVLEWLMKV